MWSFNLLLFWGYCGIFIWVMFSLESMAVDVNECADTTTCPAYAKCTDTPDSYYCTCKRGFLSSNGMEQFKGPGVTCIDIDECSQSPPPCGPNSVCRNLLGRYKCSCWPGFSSPTGNDWILGNPGRFICTDINECLSSGVCQEHAECINTSGSYKCRCQVGFIAHNSICKDIDECSQSPPPCGPNSVCENLLGRYKCNCLPGFSSPTGNNWISGNPGRFICTDINECLSSGVCQEHAECINTLGSYKCRCQVGFISHNSICKDVDECADPRTCPEHATCHNSPGSYSCVCNVGFESSGGKERLLGSGEICGDVDECARNSTICGLNSVCTNILGKYNCSCLPGYFSPAVWTPEKPEDFICTDIDECSQDPSPCGPNSVCINTLGSYSCRCNKGFRPNPGGSSNFTCQNVNECADTTTCPAYAKCTDTLDSYYCTCKRGFLPSNGVKQFKGPGVTCIDIDECSQSPPPCGPNSVCENILGRYKCSCLPGFSSPTGNDWILGNPGRFICTDINECLSSGVCQGHAECINTLGSYKCRCQVGFIAHNSICEDIDECSQDPSPCGPNSVCTNTLGSYSCSCLEGFRPNAGGSLNFTCKRIPFKCKEDVIPDNEWVQLCQVGAAVEREHGSFCTLMNATFNVLDDACENRNTVVSLKSTVESFASVLEQTSTSNFTKEETSALATVVLESVKSTTLAAFLKPSANVSQTIQTEQLEIESKIIKEECNEENMTFHFKAKGDEMKIGCSTIEESKSTGTTGVAFVSFLGMESFLDESFFQDQQMPLAISQRKVKMNSRVVQGIMTGEKKDGFSDPIIYTLENIEPKQEFERPICVSWDTNVEGGRWTSSGCVVLEASETHTVCSCNQMVNLAIIMAYGELTMDFSLYIISHVGMIISLVCLVLAITTFILCRSIQNHNTYLHLHLCVCLFLAKALFLTGVDKIHNKMGCAIIAGFLHYLYLACFFWMLIEAVMLFLMVRNLKVVNYFSSRHIKMWYLCVFGYGIPGLVVAVSVGVQPQGYGMHNRCWLNTETGFIWSFLGPVCTIIVINSILLTWTLCILRQKLSSVNAEVSKLKDNRLLTCKAFAQLFILGCSWVLGIFQIGSMARIMAYLFTIINSLQGAFIFIIHCLLNRQVQEEYRRCLTRKIKPSSESHTSGILLSSVPSTSKTD
ncbi:adhesion G protein-coupled receptor E1 precursor [Canis lupus familiaris]|uniref:EMR1 n=1 Tax=Canis lupus familiaris TaxID=9615 RepID=Q2Q422_CANLF|nr:adhesion G protein-coupled receptor E1 precursor [Canis lupus familiaris]ABB53646.1 EMR1 [Canis lupus familiaris]|eukprot:NP_001033757.1 adhesion G protein-coupled receptor E1 precursor [Canis lupus familiaris]